MTDYIRPLVQTGPARPDEALSLAGGWGWFTHVEVLRRDAGARVIPASELTRLQTERLAGARAPIAGLALDRPRIMGIINTTPDSFSDGGVHAALADAVAGGLRMIESGADILDIGGESTRPGAQTVDTAEEIARTVPVIQTLRGQGAICPISIDTRKTPVAQSALAAGANLINDVAGFTYDAALAPLAATAAAPVCVMHAQGDPATMQQNPIYDDVLLDVYDFLDQQISALERIGIPRSRILADPGIGFGKTLVHNLTLLAGISLFHSLGVAVLLGASRKRFIGTIGGGEGPARAPGSIGVALAGIAQGVQMVRVHDVVETAQAIALWRASTIGSVDD